MVLFTWKTCCARVHQRWIFAVMGCLAIASAYTMQFCLSLAIIEMVATTETARLNSASSDETCPSTTGSTSSNTNSSGTYEWDEYTQGLILSSFYWGYIITQLPGGMVAQKFGGKHTLGLGILSSAILSLVTPLVVDAYEATGLIVLRILMGLCGGTTFPAIGVLIAHWAPPLERSKINSVILSGSALGTVVANGLSGMIIQSSSIGWRIVFYFYGTLGALWFLAWVVLCYSTPEVHPFISDEEKKYIQESTRDLKAGVTDRIPWLQMATSMPVWSVIIGKAGVSCGYYVILTDLPKYMSSVLKFSIQANGLLSALPYVTLCFVGTTSAWLVDWLIQTERMSRTNLRKVCHTVASVISSVVIIAAVYVGCDRTIAVVLFTIGVGLMGTLFSSVMVNPNDLSPNHSGILMAIVNAVGSLAGILAPYIVGILTPNQTLSEWRIVFWIIFAIHLASTLVFDVWADGKTQYWNDLDSWNNQQKQNRSKDLNSSEPSDQPPGTA